MKSLLFCLFIYVCLVWVVAFYRGGDVQQFGLLGTAAGLTLVLAFVAIARLFGWWRLWRAKAAARPPASPKPAAPVHPQDAEMAALLNEANEVLAKAPSFAGKRGGKPLSALPLYLLIGPEGSGKTSTFLNSGLEPQLLAGTGVSPVAPTRLCNLWLAKNAIFAEIGGRAFAGEAALWDRLLGALRGNHAIPAWRRLWGEPEPQANLRGVIAFFNAEVLTGASSDPQRIERYSLAWQERLRAIAARFGAEFPVYFVITNGDKIPFFSDFFRRLPESEINQVLGCTLAIHQPGESNPSEVFVQAEAKRLNASFRPLYQALAKRRLTHLAREPNPAQRPGIYEFPRELKRIRPSLVQFLTEIFRPNSLGPGPVLRGYYVTGCRGEADVDEGAQSGLSIPSSLEATGLFRGDATQIFKVDIDRDTRPGSRNRSGVRWMFIADLFHKVVLPDAPVHQARPRDDRFARRRQLTLGRVCALCVLMSLVFFVSWAQNRKLLSEVEGVSKRIPDRQDRLPTVDDLRSLEALRTQLVRLQDGLPWSYHWGLYSGDRVLEPVRTAYFRRFSRLLLIEMNALMVSDLRALPSSPEADAPDDPPYRLLKTHLTVSSGGCEVDPPVVAGVLKAYRGRVASGVSTEWQGLADGHIDFYARELAGGNPSPLREDTEGRDNARRYLEKVTGIDKLYEKLLAEAEKKLGKRTRLSDIVPNYTQVLSGPDEVGAAFSPEGWSFLEKASKESRFTAPGDPCVVGGSTGVVSGMLANREISLAIQRKFLRDYVERWRNFVAGFSVVRYSSAGDAARKLEVLESHRSPLLGVLLMTANQTNFPAPVSKVDGVIQRIEKAVGKAGAQAKAAVTPAAPTPDSLNSPADISRFFQPVHWVEPPGSEIWIVEKNAAYISALQQLRSSMQDIAQQPGIQNPDPAVHQTADQNYRKALDAVGQLARGFKPLGVNGLDITVKTLLEQPIKLTNPFIVRDLEKAGAEKINQGLRQFCASAKPALSKYPMQPSSEVDASLDELASLFDPAKGAVWKFQQQALGEFTVKDGAQWKSADPAKKPQVTQQMLAFLNRSQVIADVFFQGGGPARFTYTLRPKLDSLWKDYTLELEVDGLPFNWTSGLQHQFSWPAPPGSKGPEAVARLRGAGSVRIPFASRGGIWGIFRILGDAEPRDLGGKLAEWKYLRGGVGRRELIEPAPVHLELVGFPGGQDIFNPKFWNGLSCPATAVQ